MWVWTDTSLGGKGADDGVVCEDDLVDEMANCVRGSRSSSLLHIRAAIEKRERAKLGTIR